MSDGVVLRADVYRPEGRGPWPVLLQRTPYGKETAQTDGGYPHPAWFARHGYLVVVQDVRGRWSSDGAFTPFRDEAADGAATVEWAARLPGCDGRVAMYGFSYAGAAQLLAAAAKPPALAAICPAFTSSRLDEGWTYTAGAFGLAFAAPWALGLALDDARRRRDEVAVAELAAALRDVDAAYDALPLRAHGALARHAPYYLEWLEHGSGDPYWQRWAVGDVRDSIAVPCLLVGGWWDAFLRGTVDAFERLRATSGAPTKLVVGPWAHAGWQPLGADDPTAGPTAVADWHLRWLDHVLRNHETGVLDSPVTVHLPGVGWRALDDWPPPSARPAEWFLHSHGRANSAAGDGALSLDPPRDEPPDLFVYDPAYPAAGAGGHAWPFVTGPADQSAREGNPSVLVYTSPPLAEDVELIGEAVLVLHAATSAVDTDFTARLCVVEEDGVSTNLQEGIVRARFRDSLVEPLQVPHGEVLEYRLRLGPVGARVAAGRRLRLQVSSSDFPLWDRNLNTGGRPGNESLADGVVATQVVLHDSAHPSRLLLPVSRPG